MLSRLLLLLFSIMVFSCNSEKTSQSYLQVSGVYPHLAVFNPGDGLPCHSNGNECGIGAVVPWAGKLWMITYSPHCLEGSSDKLYSIDENLNLKIQPESVGGTPANRMIHRESEQLIIGPYFISKEGKVRVLSPEILPGRHTATLRHLKDPENKVYFFEMEGPFWEVDVHTLETKELYHKPVPGWHGKGAYSGQGRVVIANNGEHQVFDIDPDLLQAGGAPKNEDEMGVLAEWDGENWNIVERKQFTDVTGPGGIYGSNSDSDPIWSIGWDKRSVILKLLDGGEWFTYRLPKSTHTYDHWGGWFTEWPRIREIGNGDMLMDMHGMFYDFPASFSRENSAGIRPVANHLRYVPDFTSWNGKLVIATDETSILQNPIAGRSQSNLWFGQKDDMKNWGPKNGFGGVWANDQISAGEASDPLLIAGFDRKVLHLAHDQQGSVLFTLEIDKTGNNKWEELSSVEVGTQAYNFSLLPENLEAEWVRIKADQDCKASAYFHFYQVAHGWEKQTQAFDALAEVDDKGIAAGWIRPAAHNYNLQFLTKGAEESEYVEVDEKLSFQLPQEDHSREVDSIARTQREFEVDAASVIVSDKSGSYRLPRTLAEYDQPFEAGWPRGKREVESERYLANYHGTFYEIPREAGLSSIRPITTHQKQIIDYCTWRGLLVMSGTKRGAKEDGNYFASPGGDMGLWFGAIDDIWQLGKPKGEGGPWKNSTVTANKYSLPYLMTGYDQKTLTLEADKDVSVILEVDFDHRGWHELLTFELTAGEEQEYQFPEGFSAHWLRLKANKDCQATAWLKYE